MVAAALKDASKPDLKVYLKERVMDPLGIPEEEWGIGYGNVYSVDGLSVYPAAGNFSARAVARVGQLLLHRGNWEGQQIIDPELMGVMSSYAARADLERPEETPGPTIGGWSNFDRVWPTVPSDAIVAVGAHHKAMLAVPSEDLIVVRFGDSLLENPVWTAEGGRYFKSLEEHLLAPLMTAMTDASVSAEGN